MSKRLIRLPGVINKVGLQKTYIWNGVKEHTFPAPIKVGSASLWLESDIDKWIEEKITEAKDGAIIHKQNVSGDDLTSSCPN